MSNLGVFFDHSLLQGRDALPGWRRFRIEHLKNLCLSYENLDALPEWRGQGQVCGFEGPGSAQHDFKDFQTRDALPASRVWGTGCKACVLMRFGRSERAPGAKE